MDTERLKITAETAAIRGRGWLRLAVRLAGIALVLVAAGNFFTVETWTAYRAWFATVIGEQSVLGLGRVADFVAMGVGAAVAHFV